MATISVQTDGQAAAEERRRFDRTALVVRVEYSTVDDLFSEFTHDINEGGVFIETSDPQPIGTCLLYTSPSPRDQRGSRMPSSA